MSLESPDAVDVGSKRKAGEIDEPPSKKQKLISRSSSVNHEIIPELPQECWENIISNIQLNTAISAFFVSKKLRRAFCRLLYQKLSNDLGIPLAKACFVPKSVKRRFSGLDIYSLLERTKTASEQRNFTLLLTLSDQLQKLSNMIAFLSDSSLKDYWDERDEELDALQSKYCQSVVFTSMSAVEALLHPGTDGQVSNTSRSILYCWFGVDKTRYAEIDWNLVEGSSSADNSCWRSSHCVVKLKELGSNYRKEISMQDSFRRHPYDDSDRDTEAEIWNDDDKQTILNWLGIPANLELKTFRRLMPSHSLFYASLSTGWSASPDEREWNGELSGNEMDCLMQLFLINQNNWAKDTEFLANRMSVKLILMNRVKKANFTSEGARDEFLLILEHAAIMVRAFHDVRFTQYDEGRRDLHEDVELIIYHKDTTVPLIYGYGKMAGTETARISLCHWLGDSSSYLSLPSFSHDSISNADAQKIKLIELLELKNLTVANLNEALDKMVASAESSNSEVV